ncbi:MAG TPA: FAD-dependent oxidoreductase [Rhizomicrobium sp.]|nr:FAD-dependent oxidoreductase [Rhizomicrobium sp.]
MRYDAAIIGAGAEGLAAATALARKGLKIIVIERNDRPGGRCITCEFHPGFRASPYCDAISPIPSDVFWSLDLGRRGVVFLPPGASTALWPGCAFVANPRESRLLRQGATAAEAALSHAAQLARQKTKQSFFSRRPAEARLWPGDDNVTPSLSDCLARDIADGDLAALTMAEVFSGRAAHPGMAGSGLHLLAAASGPVAGGLQRLTDALYAAACDAGAEFSFGLEVMDIRRYRGTARALGLADGSEVSARAIVSTLDLKRTFLSLFAWSDLPMEVSARAGTFRMAGGTARLLFALSALPPRPAFAEREIFRGPIHVAPDAAAFGTAYADWRAGTVSPSMPVTLRFPSVADPGLSPSGAAVMTATVGAVPFRLFDGAWTHERRAALQEQVLGAVENVLPGTRPLVLASALIVPPDIEEALGLTDGDLDSGEIAADQIFGLRPGFDAPRTPIDGLYLTGSTTASLLGTCAAGVNAASAVLADLKTGRLK